MADNITDKKETTENTIPSWIGNPYANKGTPSDALDTYKTTLANNTNSADPEADLAAYKSALKTSYKTSPYGNNLESEIADYKNNFQTMYEDTGKTYDQALADKKTAIQEATNSSVNQLRSEWDNTVKQYDQTREKAAYSKAQATDNLAAYSQANGDRGGVANKLMSDQTAAYDNQIMQIDLEQINLKNQVEQQVAQLISEGKIQEAEAAYEIGIAKMQALNNMKTDYYNTTMNVADTLDNRRLTEYQLQQEEEATKLNNFYTMLQLGMFDEASAIELGVPAEQAKEFADYINQEAKLSLENAKVQLQSAYKSLNSSGSSGESEETRPTLNEVYSSLYASGITDPIGAKAALVYGGYSDEEADSIAAGYNNWYNANKAKLFEAENAVRSDSKYYFQPISTVDWSESDGVFHWNGKSYAVPSDLTNDISNTPMTDADFEGIKKSLDFWGFDINAMAEGKYDK